MAEHETKFVFPAGNSKKLRKWLMGRCVTDGSYPVGIISSIYYDTIDFNFLDEKINSDFLKTKFRLRWYQDVETHDYSPLAYFEMKKKTGSAREKKRTVLTMHETIKNASYLNEPFFIEQSRKLFSKEMHPGRAILPVMQISYRRYRFIDRFTGARLAVDYDIHVPRINPMMIKKADKSMLNVGVFECKSESMNLPDWLHGVTIFGCRKGSFSKYSSCYQHVTGNPV